MDGDTDKGTSTVKIGGETVTQKNVSYYTKCTGNEAGCAPMKNVISHVNTGKEYAHAWSGNVKMDGEPVSRFSDLSTNDHASPQGGGPPWAKVGKLKVDGNSCKSIVAEFHEYRHADCDDGSKSHHVIDNASLTMVGARKVNLKDIDIPHANEFGRQKRNLFQPADDPRHPGSNYDEMDAPCICLEGEAGNSHEEHGGAHDITKSAAAELRTSDGKWTYADAREAGIESICAAKGWESEDEENEPWQAACIRAILDAYYKDELGCTETTEISAPPTHRASAKTYDDGYGNQVPAWELT
jgi:hypothetical protein